MSEKCVVKVKEGMYTMAMSRRRKEKKRKTKRDRKVGEGGGEAVACVCVNRATSHHSWAREEREGRRN